jgi:hypothetical protein
LKDVIKGLLAQEPTSIPHIRPNLSGIDRKKAERPNLAR